MNPKPTQYIDIHAHVNFAAYDEDREAVIERALEAGVWMINVGTQKDTSKSAVELVEKYEKGVYAIVGIHPIHTDKSFHDEKELGSSGKELAPSEVEGFVSRGEVLDENYYRELLKHPKVLGIGECGLDYYRCTPESEKKQRESFSAQIALANEFKKPLMLHVRNPSTGSTNSLQASSGQAGSGKSAYRDALEILKSEAKVSGNFHFFAGSWEEAKEILDAGFFLSFTGVITFARQYDEIIKNTPLDRIMTETDCPYVSPEPFRGKRNEPMHVREVVKKISEIKGEDFEKVRETLLQNALKFFAVTA
ncbi:MAG: TatD family hydrolase [Candidatus Paceibacterota bacterium]|nr:MAG: TatD family hydrolase [Candidatus Paceibacterota bacterium]